MKRLLLLFLLGTHLVTNAQSKTRPISVIGYYAGDAVKINAYPIEKLSHIIFSFCHLKGNKLNVDNARDTLTIKKLVELKSRNPKMKVILSLGGWTGCETCSPVFATEANRMEFAKSVKRLNDYFKTDGIDLDWEYPAIPGPPGHPYMPADRENFTDLVKQLRKELGSKHEISFAAGGSQEFLEKSIDWKKVSPMVDKINLMTYDLVHGNSTVSGNHTPLYSTPEQKESTDYAVKYLASIGVPKNKMVIGAAFYSRIFQNTTDANKGLYQPTKFYKGISYNEMNKDSLQKAGFTAYWDDVAKAPYMYSPEKKQLITGDDARSIELKTKYAVDQKLNGIMFWQLADDKSNGGLLDVIDNTLKGK